MNTRFYKHQAVILREGQACDRVCFLIRGRCKIYTTGSSGQLLIQNVVSAPEVFGMIEQFKGLNNVCTVEAFGDVETHEMTTEDYLRRLSEDHSFTLEMLKRVCDIAYSQIEHQSANIMMPLKDRLSGYLIANYEHQARIALDKPVLAGQLATTIRHLNRTIRSLEAAGVLTYCDGKIYNVDWKALEVYKTHGTGG